MEEYESLFSLKQTLTEEVIRLYRDGRLESGISEIPLRHKEDGRLVSCLIQGILGCSEIYGDRDLKESAVLCLSHTTSRLPAVTVTGEAWTGGGNPCPAGALRIRDGKAFIAEAACISCGRCSMTAPAIVERSEIMSALSLLASKPSPIAVVAPTVADDFGTSFSQIVSSLTRLGFSQVTDASYGVRIMTEMESAALTERNKENRLLLTGCCAGCLLLRRKLLRGLDDYVSGVSTPVEYTVRQLGDAYPDHQVVFIGPCLAKKVECSSLANVKAVLLSRELAALFRAYDIEVEKDSGEDHSDALSRLAEPSAIAEAVVRKSGLTGLRIDGIDGIDRDKVKLLSSWSRKPPDADIIELMLCPGGCGNGPGTNRRTADISHSSGAWNSEA